MTLGSLARARTRADTHPATIQYAINDCYASIQGEGKLTGTPMVVLRMQGCAVRCTFCDSRETWGGGANDHTLCLPAERPWKGATPFFTRMTAPSIAGMCRATAPALAWVLITGGEPAEQELQQLVDALRGAGFRIALETSGTGDGCLDATFDHVALSPKPGNPGMRPLLRPVVRMADEVKWLVARGDDIATAVDFSRDYTIARGRISLQPISQDERATKLCLDAAVAYGFGVSVQLHRYLGIR